MTESIVADFVARFVVDSAASDEPSRGRIIMSQKRLIMVTGEGKTTIALPSVFDVAVEHVPPGVSGLSDHTVTIGYTKHGKRRTAIIEAEREILDRFTSVLFRAALNGTTVTVKHPSLVGDRAVDAAPRTASLRLGKRAVAFVDLDEPFTVDLGAVIRFRKSDRPIDGEVQPALCVRHVSDGTALTTEITMASRRKMNLLGRYLRLEYGEMIEEVRDLELGEGELEVLAALYSDGGDADLARLPGVEADRANRLLDSLGEEGLVSRGGDGAALTPKGRMAVIDRIEDEGEDGDGDEDA